MARRDTNFYYSFVALTAEKRRAIVAVWDFFRAVDDSVDEASDDGGSGRGVPEGGEASERIALWRREVAALYDGGAPRTPQGRALVPYVGQFGLPRQAFEDVIAGVEMDTTTRRWGTFDDLYPYCLRVASAVGLVCIEIFGYRNPACRQYATDLGVALQLTNILRDVGKDLRCGRLYLPQDDLMRFGVTEDTLRSGTMTPAVRLLLAHQASRAREYFEKADRELPREDARALVAARIMGAIYAALLQRIERSCFAVFGEPLRLPRWQKALIALRTWCATMVRT
jgi:phytoene synthase